MQPEKKRKVVFSLEIIFQKHPLILAVKTENRGNTTSNNPYIAFRRRTEKMQTRKNRKNDETSYEKMLKLRYCRFYAEIITVLLITNFLDEI